MPTLLTPHAVYKDETYFEGGTPQDLREFFGFFALVKETMLRNVTG